MEPRGTAAERLRTALALYEFAEAMLRRRLRRTHPKASRDRIESLVQAWRQERPGAEHGDGIGRRGAWPRKV